MSKKKHNKVKKQKGETYMDALCRDKCALGELTADIMSQIDFDAACFACRDVFHMGPKRATEFKKAMERYAMEIGRLVFADCKDDEDFVHSMATNDEGLHKIVGEENFVSARRRYLQRR